MKLASPAGVPSGSSTATETLSGSATVPAILSRKASGSGKGPSAR